ncbi:MAG: PepSY domain-containing protein [bacterium]|nr:PepSY domain-containing protein [bacterium]
MLTLKKSFRLIPAVAISLYGAAAFASEDDLRLNSETKAEITEQLTQEGYEVRKIEAEDGYYEAYAIKNGARYEIYLDKNLKIAKVKED